MSLGSRSQIYNSPLSFHSQNGKYKVVFAPTVLEHFHVSVQERYNAAEAGGQLFADLSNEIVRVVLATGPRKTDRRSRYFFQPDRRKENAEIKKQFKSGLHYIGDWHTHPQDIPIPSSIDVENIQDCFNNSRHQLVSFIMVIVGRNLFPDGLSVSLHNHATHEFLSVEHNI